MHKHIMAEAPESKNVIIISWLKHRPVNFQKYVSIPALKLHTCKTVFPSLCISTKNLKTFYDPLPLRMCAPFKSAAINLVLSFH